VEWLKVKALSSNPSTAKERERREGGTKEGRREKLTDPTITWTLLVL
jgi:hypothetical protein